MKYRVTDSFGQVLIDNANINDAMRLAQQHMQQYERVVVHNGLFYCGKRHKRNLRLRVEQY